MMDVTQTITNVTVISEEHIRRWELANHYRLMARTKLLILAKNPALTDEERQAIVTDAIHDIYDGMSILQRGFIQPLGCHPSRVA